MKKRVLFLCTGNSCRSQIAEGLLRHLAGNKYEVFSAGINPTVVNPHAIEVMKEIGIDISSYRSKSVDEFKNASFDFVITVCNNAKESCPYFAGSKMIHWNIEDPAVVKFSTDEKYNAFRTARDKLLRKIHSELLQDI
ncbi:MAG: arsenate reductase ArsC [Pseudomonadota bacterium]